MIFNNFKAIGEKNNQTSVYDAYRENLNPRVIWIAVGHWPIVLAVGAGGVVWTYFLSPITSLLFLPPSGRRPYID